MLLSIASQLHQPLHWLTFLSCSTQLMNLHSYGFISQDPFNSSLAFGIKCRAHRLCYGSVLYSGEIPVLKAFQLEHEMKPFDENVSEMHRIGHTGGSSKWRNASLAL